MKTSIRVQNLKCGGCAKTILTKISGIEGIKAISIDVENSLVSFTSEDTDSVIVVKNKLSTIGYPYIEDENTLTARAKSFVSCATGKISL